MLHIESLSVGYGQSQVLQNFSLTAHPGEILAIAGRNGMGKTTLLKSLTGLIPSIGGSIRLDGREISACPTHERVAHGLGFVPQGRMIFPGLSVYENLISGARKVVEKSALDEIHALFPVLFDMRNRKGGNLSGGQQQQLAIGRALMTDPKVLLLDEPTEGIQPSIIKEIARALRQIRQARNLTILVTEQVLSFILEACDRLVVIERGRIIHEELRANADAEKIKALLSV